MLTGVVWSATTDIKEFVSRLHSCTWSLGIIHAKSGRYLRYISAIFLDFPQNFRLRTRNQYCTQAIAWGSTILDGGSTILDGSSTIFCRFSPFFVDFHHFLSIFTIYALLSRFTFCRDLRIFSANFFGQNSHHRNITRFLHVWLNQIYQKLWKVWDVWKGHRCNQFTTEQFMKAPVSTTESTFTFCVHHNLNESLFGLIASYIDFSYTSRCK